MSAPWKAADGRRHQRPHDLRRSRSARHLPTRDDRDGCRPALPGRQGQCGAGDRLRPFITAPPSHQLGRIMATEFAHTLPMRPAETNTKPRFPVPQNSCDTHFHVFEPGFPHVPEPLYTFPDGTLEKYLHMTEWLR